MGSIGRRWKPRKGRSRAVLIARTACARAALPPGRGAHGTFVRVSPRRCPLPKSSMFSLLRRPVPFFMSTILALAPCAAPPRSRWPWRRGPPLSIPNREVKPASADGTAREGGRVGRRLTSKASVTPVTEAFFYFYFFSMDFPFVLQNHSMMVLSMTSKF